jgi:hypothetical protein
MRILGLAHVSRVLTSASSRGSGDFDSPTHRRQATPRRTVWLITCAPFCWLRSMHREILKGPAVTCI